MTCEKEVIMTYKSVPSASSEGRHVIVILASIRTVPLSVGRDAATPSQLLGKVERGGGGEIGRCALPSF